MEADGILVLLQEVFLLFIYLLNFYLASGSCPGFLLPGLPEVGICVGKGHQSNWKGTEQQNSSG